jgi:hypothetical protein
MERQSQFVVLKDPAGQFRLEISIGPSEAESILLVLESIQTPRPMTHDLLKNILRQVGVGVQRVIVSDYRDQTYFAVIELLHQGQPVSVDARTSDAIALALRTGAPVLLNGEVIEKSRRTPPAD